MTLSSAAILVLILAAFAANLPFCNERWMGFGPVHPGKHLGWRLGELVAYAGIVLGFGVALETQLGQRAPQGWEFYAAFGFLMITMAFPGFVWRYLRRA